MLTRVTGAAAVAVLVLGLLTAAFEFGAARAAETAPLPEEFEALAEVYERVRDDAVNAPPDAELVEGAIEGMLQSLEDDYAAYYDNAEFRAITGALDARFVGVGVVLDTRDGDLVIQTVLPDSPAEAAGLRAGERIVAVDGADIGGLDPQVAIEQIRGAEGTPVELGVEDASGAVRTVPLIRRELELPNVDARLLDDGVGYVQLRQFSADAAVRVREAVRELRDQGARGYVLDLRGNPGGRLPAAIDVTGVFVSDGEVVRVGNDGGSAHVYRTDRDALAPEAPLVVLVDEGSASASEIVAGAVQDLDRGEVVGETTFGKGTVQTIQMLPEGGGLKFTTDRYYTPSGDSIDGVGVQPDVVVEPGEGDGDRQLEAAQQELAEQLATLG